MKNLKTIGELLLLKPKEIFTVIKGGNSTQYMFVSEHPKHQLKVLAMSTSDHTDFKTFGQDDITENKIFLSGEYNSDQVGRIMIRQLESEISGIRQIYCNEK